jgi:short-subunit dehydrogenase
VYSATKGLLDHFTNAIRHEFKNVDFINVRPGFVSTGMTLNKKKSFDTLTVDECVDGIIRDIGLVENTYGHWRHQIQNHFIEGLPLSLVHYVYMKSEVAKLLKIR